MFVATVDIDVIDMPSASSGQVFTITANDRPVQIIGIGRVERGDSVTLIAHPVAVDSECVRYEWRRS